MLPRNLLHRDAGTRVLSKMTVLGPILELRGTHPCRYTPYQFVPRFCRTLRRSRRFLQMDSAVRTHDLRKTYHSAPPAAAGRAPSAASGKGSKDAKPQIKALDGIDLEVAPGEIFGLLGPNGAGKSTTVGILTTRVRPTSGTAWIGEYD